MSLDDLNAADDCASRFERVTRKMVLRRAAIMSGLILMPGIACSNGDEAAFGSSTSTTANTTSTSQASSTTETSATVVASSSSSTVDTAAASQTTSDPETTSTAAASTTAVDGGASFPAGGEVVVKYTFTAGSGGMGPARNPYTAVWIEDTNGNLVAVLDASYLQSQKGQRWLNELRRWYSLGGADASASVTGATRPAGEHSVTWDGKGLDGNPVPAGEYMVVIEAAREHGPYELVAGNLTISDSGFSADFTPQGELTAASVEFTA